MESLGKLGDVVKAMEFIGQSSGVFAVMFLYLS